MPNYEITTSVHIPDELIQRLDQIAALATPPAIDLRHVGDSVSHAKPVVEEKPEPVEPKPAGPVTIEQAKAAVIAWAEKNGGPAKAKDNLQKNFGIKMSEMDESQAEAVLIHFTGGAN